jgi:hypothetical protein
MVYALTSDQVEQVVENTLLVLLGRPDLLGQWHANLEDLLNQALDSDLEDEALFVAAVLALLNVPDDRLATGTVYDQAWESIVIGLQTGVIRPAQSTDEAEQMSLDRLLASVVEAVIAIMQRSPEEKGIVQQELQQMHAAATEAGVTELAAWVEDVLGVLDGRLDAAGHEHAGIYAAYWEALQAQLRGDDND